MDSAATDFSLHQTGAATPLAGHTKAVVGGSFPQQQTPSLAEQNNGSSSSYYRDLNSNHGCFVQYSTSYFVKAYKQ
jgi:S-adenosylmethionine:diacylglycerol 3-amino-3-carboxypropyl transferase